MKYLVIPFGLILIAIVLFVGSDTRKPIVRNGPPQRIISLAPSITEIIYALKLEDRLAGVTRFCKYPVAAQKKPQIGGFQDLNIEAALTLKPDLVIHLPCHRKAVRRMEELGVPLLKINTGTIKGIQDGIAAIAKRCDADSKELLDAISERISRVKKVGGKSVLVVVSRTLGAGEPTNICVAGAGTFYDDLLKVLGAKNACPEGLSIYPSIGREGLLTINPDYIVDLLSGMETRDGDIESAKDDWQRVPQLDAVRRKRVHVISDDFVTVPGPRFVLLLDKLERLLSSE